MEKPGGPNGFQADWRFDGSSAPTAPPSYEECVGGGQQRSQQGWAKPDQRAQYPTNSGAPPYFGGGGGQPPYPTGAVPYGGNQPQAMPQGSPMGPCYPQQPPFGAAPEVVYQQCTPGAQFDAGARFTNYTPPSIPPPPPGFAPNAAQLAAARGANVAVPQKKGGFFNGSGSGGYTFW